MTWNERSIEKRRIFGFTVASILAVASLTACGGDGDTPGVVNPNAAVATPVFDIAGGTFRAAQSIAIHTTTEGATIRYTMDGTTPSSTSTIYSGPLSIAKTGTLKAIAVKAGSKDSTVQSATYIIEIPSGTVNPVQFGVSAGEYSHDVSVPLSSDTAGATICYTLDGSSPACDAAARCSAGSSTYDGASPVQIRENGKEIRGIACKSNMAPSSESRAAYTLEAAAPVFGAAPGTLDPSKSLEITVTTSTAGGTIHYTMDGRAPDCNSPSVVSGGKLPKLSSDTTNIQALTCKDQYVNSSIVSSAYSIGNVCGGTIEVTTQAGLEGLSRCTEIAESLLIHGGDIQSLSPLRHLVRVGTHLNVYQTSLTSFQGLERLTTVGGRLYVGDNPALSSLDELSALERIEKSLTVARNAITEWIGPSKLTHVDALYIRENPNLRHVGGFAALAEMRYDFAVEKNAALTSFDGMPALTKIDGYATFQSNDALESVSSFDKMRELGGLTLGSHASLTRFDAFSKVTVIHGHVTFEKLPKLSQLDLKNVTTIEKTLYIGDGALTSLEGLSGLVTADAVTITEGHDFPDLKGLEQLTTVPGTLQITNTRGRFASLAGLDNLTLVGGLEVFANENLESLRGLDKLANVTSPYPSVFIARNSALREIGSLDALRSSNYLTIDYNPKLTHLNGLRNVPAAIRLSMWNNEVLTKLDGLDALADVSGDVSIFDNGLTSLDELHSLKRIGGALSIVGNDALTNLAGLGTLTELGGNLSITNNLVMPTCHAEGLARTLLDHGYHGTVTIEKNGGSGSCVAP